MKYCGLGLLIFEQGDEFGLFIQQLGECFRLFLDDALEIVVSLRELFVFAGFSVDFFLFGLFRLRADRLFRDLHIDTSRLRNVAIEFWIRVDVFLEIRQHDRLVDDVFVFLVLVDLFHLLLG